ncbi:DDB1- and CUL4-associated factor 5-like [Tubulanus polymorphus]|uniref:DDB1- and CUL4-associated factor 5-like n=1 Tax=Tubulanus polymorphus TaxID=672921 RepID=UPI003DA40E12
MSEASPISYLFHRHYRDNAYCNDRFLRERMYRCKNLFKKDLKAHFGCVNAIEFSHTSGELMASGGDDRRVLLWNVEDAVSSKVPTPVDMKGQHHSNIFTLAFDHENRRIFSGGNDEQVVVHDMSTRETVDVFLHEDAVYGLSTHPTNNELFASACEDGRILIYDLRQSTSDPFCLANYVSAMHSVMFNPVEPRLIVTANAKDGIGLWDIRKPKSCVLRYGGGFTQQSAMSVRFNRLGDRIISLRRRLPPVLYSIQSADAVYQFDHTGYYNSCTMKSCCFAGDKDQYLLSGSDDFNLYMWRIPETRDDDKSEVKLIESAHLVLKGHRSIVNQVRFNPANHLIISSGVEKVIKAWSPFPMNMSCGGINDDDEERERPVYSHEEYLNLVIANGHVMEHDYSQQSIEEDPRMMAFFDSLVQRELEEWDTDSLSTNSDDFYTNYVEMISDGENLSGSEAEMLQVGRFPIPLPRTQLSELIVTRSEPRTGDPELASEPVELVQAETDDPQPAASNSASPDNDVDSLAVNNNELTESDSNSGQRTISSLIEKKRKVYVARMKKPSPAKSMSKKKKRKLILLKRKISNPSDFSSSDSDSNGEANSDSTDNSKRCAKKTSLPPLLQTGQSGMSTNLSRLKILRSRVTRGENDHEPQAGTSRQSTETADEQRKPVAPGKAFETVTVRRQSNETDATGGAPPSGESNAGEDNRSNDSGVPGQNGEITWTEFKRFKNKLERARRKYRRQSQQDQSSGDDATEPV